MNTIQINKPGNSTVVLISAPIGSYYETNEYKGISHYLEHMNFKGTKKRTQKQISATIENIGGDLNAFTDYEITCYWAKVSNSFKNTAIDVLEDMTQNSILPEKEVNKEREVITQELKMYEDNPINIASDIFYQTLFSNDSGFYYPIGGTQESIKKIDKPYLKLWKDRYYDKDNLVKIIVGDVKDSINFCPESKTITYSLIKINAKDKIIKRKELQQANIVVGNYIESANHSNSFLNYLLISLYNDQSGRLFQKIREQHNLVYRIEFDVISYRNKGIMWSVNLGLEKKNINKAREFIIKELIRPANKREKDILITKSIGGIELMLDNKLAVAENIAYNINKNLDYNYFIQDYKKQIKKNLPYLNDYIKELNFKNNILAGVVGE